MKSKYLWIFSLTKRKQHIIQIWRDETKTTFVSSDNTVTKTRKKNALSNRCLNHRLEGSSHWAVIYAHQNKKKREKKAGFSHCILSFLWQHRILPSKMPYLFISQKLANDWLNLYLHMVLHALMSFLITVKELFVKLGE